MVTNKPWHGAFLSLLQERTLPRSQVERQTPLYRHGKSILVMAAIKWSPSSPFRRHAITFDAESLSGSTVDSGDVLVDTHSVPSRASSVPEFVGSVSLGGWCSSLQPTSGGSYGSWTPHVGTGFDFDPSASPASTVDRRSSTFGVPSPSKMESVYVQRLSQTKQFADGKGGVGLIFEPRNDHLVVCGIIPGGNATHKARAPLARVFSNARHQAQRTLTAACHWATPFCLWTASRCTPPRSTLSSSALWETSEPLSASHWNACGSRRRGAHAFTPCICSGGGLPPPSLTTAIQFCIPPPRPATVFQT